MLNGRLETFNLQAGLLRGKNLHHLHLCYANVLEEPEFDSAKSGDGSKNSNDQHVKRKFNS